MKLTRTQPGLMPSQPRGDLALELVRALEVDAEQPVPVRAGARAAAAGLDAEQVVEQRDDEVVVQVAPARAAHHERHDREPLGVEVAEDLDRRARCCQRARPRGAGSRSSCARITLDADRLLELEDQPGADRLDDRRRAALLAVRGVGEVDGARSG